MIGAAKPVIVTHSALQPMFPAYRDKDHSSQKENTIVFIGNIKKHKGLDCLLDAFILAKNKGLPHRLVIIGEKNNFRTSNNAILRKIESIGSDTVSFTGFVSNEQLINHLSAAALLVQPSLYEGFGLPPLEAMVLGTHALISDIPVFREIYADFPVTFFRAGDSDDLKDRIVELLLGRTTITVSLPEYLVSKYSFQKTVSIILRNLTTMQE